MATQQEELKVLLTAYKDYLIIEALSPEEPAPCWVPKRPGLLGNVLLGTKTRLGASSEALKVLRAVKPSRDAIGDIMWWNSNKGCCFGWMGLPRWLFHKDELVGDRAYAVRDGEYVQIPNEVPVKVKKALNMPRSQADAAREQLNDWCSNG